MSLEMWILVVGIIVEGPLLLWWDRRKENRMNSAAKFHELEERIDKAEKSAKDYTDKQVKHAQEKNDLVYKSILSELRYIRKRVDEARL